ncbi:MAG TPA: ATP-binding protein [Solirubrobacterales bacterium]|nr:ATP-binding protein [Solirubrobacterales bacterium]
MADKRENFRKAMAAEGFSSEEIAEALAEVEAEGLDLESRARHANVPALYLGVGFDDIELDDRKTAVMAARNWSVAITTEQDEGDDLAARRKSREQPTLEPGLLACLAKGDFSTPIPRGIYLWSDGADAGDDITGYGTGKTRIAAAVAQYVLASGKLKVRWVDIVRAMTDLNLPFRNPTYARAADRLRPPGDCELVILDDIDKQPPTERNIQPIFALVNDCVNSQTPLLITANRHPDDLRQDWGDRFGHAASSRLMAHCLDIEVTGRDRRYDGTVAA